MDTNTFSNDGLLEEIIGQTVLQLLAQQQPITLPSLLQAIHYLPDAGQVERADALLRTAFTIRAAWWVLLNSVHDEITHVYIGDWSLTGDTNVGSST